METPMKTTYFVLIFQLFVLHILTTQDYEADIVAIFASDSELQLNPDAVKAAVILGVRQATRLHPNIKFNLKLKNDSRSCFENRAGVLAAEEYYRGKVTAFVGPACSKALDPVSRMASYWDLPVYSAGGVDTLFSRKNVFSTLTRLSFSLDQVCRFIVNILMEFQWRHIVVFVDESEASEILLRNSFSTVIREGYQLFPTYKDFNSRLTTSYTKILKDASKDARVFLLLACGEVVRNILLTAYDLGMGTGEYAFLSVELLKSENSNKQFSWYKAKDGRNEEAKKIYQSLMIVSVRVPVRTDYQTFVKDILDVADQEFSIKLDTNSINPMVSSFYDCVLLYAYSLNKTISEGGDPRNGLLVARQIWNSTFYGGLTGDITINENGDREADYTLSDLDPDIGVMVPVATYFGGRKVYDKVEEREIRWPGNQGPPADIPFCGFTGNAPECKAPKVFPLEGIILLAVSAVAVLGSIIGFFAYKKIVLETQLSDMWWNIDWSDIELLDSNHLGSSLSFGKSFNSKSASTKRSIGGESAIPAAMGVHIGMYKGLKVVIKYLKINKIQLSRNLLIELKLMRDMTHENLLRFVGICVTDPNSSVITDFATRGTLSDMLSNHAINIDWMFSCSIITDISEGMNFIHGSKLEYHGHLKSTNCLIDGRFVVKLSNYGLRELWKQVMTPEQEDAANLLWTAPEHLRRRNPRLQGSKAGDVYSFSIILQEIVTRRSPFEAMERSGRQASYLSSEDIIDKLRMGATPLFRPEVAQDECPSDMLELIRKCWDETPEARPNFQEIKHKLKRITK